MPTSARPRAIAVAVGGDVAIERAHAERGGCLRCDDRQDDDLARLDRARPRGDLRSRPAPATARAVAASISPSARIISLATSLAPVRRVTPGLLQHALQDRGRGGERVALGRLQRREVGLERGDAPAASLVQQSRAFRGRVQPDDAAVVRVGFAPHQAVAFHADDETGDGGRADLFGLRQRAEGHRAPAEDEHRERRRARGGQPHGLVFAAQAPEQADGGGMQAVGDAPVDGRDTCIC